MAADRQSVPEENEISRLQEQYSELSDRIVKAIKTKLPEGSIVHWNRNGHRQTGEVLAHLGFSAHNMQLRVLNRRTQRTPDIHIYEIEECR